MVASTATVQPVRHRRRTDELTQLTVMRSDDGMTEFLMPAHHVNHRQWTHAGRNPPMRAMSVYMIVPKPMKGFGGDGAA